VSKSLWLSTSRPPGAKHPAGLGGESFRVGQALEHVVAEHPVECGGRERQRVLQVGPDEQHRGGGWGQRLGGLAQDGRAGVHADGQARHREEVDQGGAGAAAEVGHPVARPGAEQPGEPAVPSRHHRLDHRGNIVWFVRHGRTLARLG
jgi:hypothetical protein